MVYIYRIVVVVISWSIYLSVRYIQSYWQDHNFVSVLRVNDVSDNVANIFILMNYCTFLKNNIRINYVLLCLKLN